MMEVFWGIVIVTLPFAIGAALYMDKRLHHNNPDALPYKWGYYNGWMGILVSVVYAVIFFVSAADAYGRAADNYVSSGIFTLVLGALSAGFVFRNRWWTVLSIIVQFNPLLWIINGIYLKNRWNELGNAIQMSSDQGSTNEVSFDLIEAFKEQSKTVRALIAICIFWVIVAFAYLFLFEPYGYSIEWGHFLKVLIFPPAVLVAAYFLYTKVIVGNGPD
tara:strand:- start:5248 stop:5901 length:654 start_codon:yes stop_codon:yes gene_type:complete